MNRDPRLNETFILDGDIYQGRTVELTQEYPSDKTNYPKGKDWGQGAMHSLSLKTGLACRKWGLDRGNEPVSYTHLSAKQFVPLYMTQWSGACLVDSIHLHCFSKCICDTCLLYTSHVCSLQWKLHHLSVVRACNLVHSYDEYPGRFLRS